MNQKNVSTEEFNSYIQKAVDARTSTILTNSSLGYQVFLDFKEAFGFSFNMMRDIQKPQDFDALIERLLNEEFDAFFIHITPPIFIHFASLLADLNFLCYGNLALTASFCSYIGYKCHDRGNADLGSFCLTIKNSRTSFEQKYESNYFTLRLN